MWKYCGIFIRTCSETLARTLESNIISLLQGNLSSLADWRTQDFQIIEPECRKDPVSAQGVLRSQVFSFSLSPSVIAEEDIETVEEGVFDVHL